MNSNNTSRKQAKHKMNPDSNKTASNIEPVCLSLVFHSTCKYDVKSNFQYVMFVVVLSLEFCFNLSH